MYHNLALFVSAGEEYDTSTCINLKWKGKYIVGIEQLQLLWNLYVVSVSAILGSCMASFAVCMACRRKGSESVLARSHCDICGHTLQPLDLIPVLSWLCLRGRCRYCGTRIPPDCIISELALGAIFAVITAVAGISVLTLILMALATLVLYLVYIRIQALRSAKKVA